MNRAIILPMDWLENIQNWRLLSEGRKLQIRWEAIPEDVAQSMAFEREPVPVEMIRSILARIEPPALLKQHMESLATKN